MDKQSIKDKYDIIDYTEPEINMPDLKELKGIILLVGSSGSGKSTILRHNGYIEPKEYDMETELIDQFSSIENAEKFMISAGLRSIPCWFRPPKHISNGERARFDIAMNLDRGNLFIDEFTSIVDRNTAKSLSVSIRKHFDKLGGNLIVATPHRDVIDWLCPNHIYDTDKQEFLKDLPFRRPELQLTIEPTTKQDWIYFKKHHYLNTDLKGGIHCYIAKINNEKVGFISVMHMTGRDIKSFWRESRLVVLPEWQGLNIGKILSDSIAEEYGSRGYRYFSKTAHPVLGEYRENSNSWKGTSTNKKKRTSYIKTNGEARVTKGFGKTAESIIRDANRLTYSHEYVGIPDRYFLNIKSQCNNLESNKCFHKKNKSSECSFNECPFTKKVKR